MGKPCPRHPGLSQESYLPSPGHPQLALLEYTEGEGEPDPTIPGAISSSPDEAVTPSVGDGEDDFKQCQQLMPKVAMKLQTQLEEVQEP